MIEKIFWTLKVIYTNRLRELTFKDSSAFYISLIIFLFAIYKIFIGEFSSFPMLNLIPYFIILCSLTFSAYINNRKDINLLKLIFNNTIVFFICIIDLLIVNSLLIIVSVKEKYFYSLYSIIGIILLFTFYRNKTNTTIFKSFLQPLSVLLKTQLRKNKYIYLLIIITYYLVYQGIIVDNRNLYIIALVGIIYILFDITSKNEKIIYFIFSKYTNKEYIIKNELSFIYDALKFISPIIVGTLIINPIYVFDILISLLVIPSIYPLKYIYINKKLQLAISTSLILIFIIFVLIDIYNNYWMLTIFLPISYVLHTISFKVFTKNKVQNFIELD